MRALPGVTTAERSGAASEEFRLSCRRVNELGRVSRRRFCQCRAVGGHRRGGVLPIRLWSQVLDGLRHLGLSRRVHRRGRRAVSWFIGQRGAVRVRGIWGYFLDRQRPRRARRWPEGGFVPARAGLRLRRRRFRRTRLSVGRAGCGRSRAVGSRAHVRDDGEGSLCGVGGLSGGLRLGEGEGCGCPARGAFDRGVQRRFRAGRGPFAASQGALGVGFEERVFGGVEPEAARCPSRRVGFEVPHRRGQDGIGLLLPPQLGEGGEFGPCVQLRAWKARLPRRADSQPTLRRSPDATGWGVWAPVRAWPSRTRASWTSVNRMWGGCLL